MSVKGTGIPSQVRVNESAQEVAAIDMRDVRVAFGGNVVLDGMTLRVRPGFTGLIGPNGAGKTTALNVISGYLRPARGTVHIWGRDVLGQSPQRTARRGVSRTFQSPRLVSSLSALDNVLVGATPQFRHGHGAELLGMPASRREHQRLRNRAGELLELFGHGSLANHQAGGFPIGGQKIIEVARALLNDPSVLLLDEPAAGLGAEDVHGLVSGLTSWLMNRESAVVIIEHDLELITRLCPQLAVLHAGRIIRSGAPSDALADRAVIEAYLGEDFVTRS